MSVNLYKEYDDILNERKQKLRYAEENYKQLHKSVTSNTCSVKYGRNSMYLGHFCPSLVIDKITKGFKRERLLNSIPKTKNGYVVYELDNNNKLLRIKEINSYGTTFETYLTREENEEFSITLLEGRECSIIDSTRTIYQDNKLIRFDIIGSAHMWSEIYSYDIYDSKKIHCKQYYYVPKLVNSSKSIQVGKAGSPMKLFNMNLEIDDNNNVIKIEYGEFINGKTDMTCIYEK